MNIKIEEKDKIVTVTPMEKIDYMNADEFDNALREAAEMGDKMIIDLSSVEFISSAGLRSLLLADDLMSEKQGFCLKNLTESVQHILDLSGFTSELNIK